MLGLLRNRDFALVWLAGIVSRLGDLVLLIALPFYVYQLTGSTLATGGMLIAETLPRVFFGSVAGVFVDRWDRRLTMILSDAARGAILLPLLLVSSIDSLWIIYLVGFTQACVGQFFNPAKMALVPRLVPSEKLVAANALNAQVDATVGLVGPALAGGIIVALGLVGVVWIDAASFWLSAALVAFVGRGHGAPLVADAASAATAAAGRWMKVWRDWRDGIALVRGRPVLVATFLTLAAVVFADGVANVLYVPFFVDVLGAGPQELGWVITASSIGVMAGVAGIGRLGNRVKPMHLVVAGVVAAGLGNIFTVVFASLSALIVLRLLLVPAVPGINIGMNAVVQSEVEDAFRGRVGGAMGTTAGLVTLCGMLVSSSLGDSLGSAALLAASGVLYLAAGLVAIALMRTERPLADRVRAAEA